MKVNPCKCGKAPAEQSSSANTAWFECEDCLAFGRMAGDVAPGVLDAGVKNALSKTAASYWNNGEVQFQPDLLTWKQGEPWGNALDGRWLLVFFHVDFEVGAPRVVRWGSFHRPPRESIRDAWFDDHGREVGLKPIKWALIDFDLPAKETK